MFLDLFDHHRNLLVLPTDINLFYGYFPVFVDGDYTQTEREERLNRVLFDDLTEQGIVTHALDVEEFRNAFFKRVEGADLRDVGPILEQYFEALRDVSGRIGDEIHFSVVKETSLEVYATEMSQQFPNSRFIHLLRDPRDNYAAIKAGAKRYAQFGDSEKSLLYSMMHRALLGMRLADINRKTLGEGRYKVVKFEDIVSQPDETLSDICNWLQIDYPDSMLVPTVFGKPTGGNNYDNFKFFDVSGKNVGRWHERISTEEAKILEFYFSDTMDTFGYEKSFTESDILRDVGDFYKWANYEHFFFDRFAQ